MLSLAIPFLKIRASADGSKPGKWPTLSYFGMEIIAQRGFTMSVIQLVDRMVHRGNSRIGGAKPVRIPVARPGHARVGVYGSDYRFASAVARLSHVASLSR